MSRLTVMRIIVAANVCLMGLVAFLVYPYFLPDDFSTAALQGTRERGEPIIAAIEAYRSKTGRHPLTLEEANIDLDAFERPLAGGQRWTYDGRSKRGYYLIAATRIMPGPWGGIVSYSYSSESGKWQLVKSEPL